MAPMARAAALATLVALLFACDDTGADPADASADVDAHQDRLDDGLDGAADALPDVLPDVTPDGMLDAADPIADAMPDAADVMPDADVSDAMPDAAADAIVDAMPDLAPPDGGPAWIGDGICDPETVGRLAPVDRVRGSTIDAPSGAEPSCSEGGGAPERVFTWVAPADGVACLSLGASTFDTVLTVGRAPCGSAEAEVACNDDAADLGLGVQSALSVAVEAGQRYFAFVDGYAGGEVPESGEFVLEIGRGPCRDGGRLRCDGDDDCPERDRCDGGVCVRCIADGDCPMGERCVEAACKPGPMMGAGACAPERVADIRGFAVIEGSNEGAPTDDLGTCNEGTIGPEVAFRFVPDADGPVCARTLGSPIDTVLYVRRACAGEEIACNDDVAGAEPTSAVDFDAVAGEPRFVFVDTYTLADFGPFVLAVLPGPCADAPVCGEAMPCPDDGMCRVNACLP